MLYRGNDVGFIMFMIFAICIFFIIFLLIVDQRNNKKYKRLLTEDQINNILKDIRFLNFKFSLDLICEDRIIIRVDAMISDNDDRTKSLQITQFYSIYNKDLKNKVRLLKGVRKSIIRYMLHEIDELFFYKDKPIFNPHVHIGSERKLELSKLITDPPEG